MSLPSIVTFYKGKDIVKKDFINCGWICNPKTIASALKRSLSMSNEKFNWDYAEAYGIVITKEKLETE